MPHGNAGRRQSPEHIAKRAASMRGRKHTEETKAKIRATKARNPGSGNTGKKHTEEARAKISHALAGRKQSPEHIEKRAAAHRGRKHTEEAKAKMRAGKARNPGTGNTGKKASPEKRERMRQAHLGKNTGADHPLWKGDDVSYTNLHRWVARHKPKTGICVECGGSERRTQWSNTDHRYRRVLEDYVERCASCHKLHDLGLGASRG